MKLGSFNVPANCLKKLRRLDQVDKYDFPDGEDTVVKIVAMLLLDLSKSLQHDLKVSNYQVPVEEVFSALVDFFIQGYVELDEVDVHNFKAGVNIEMLQHEGLWPLPEWESYSINNETPGNNQL
jgi:hypothetical protein